MRQKRAKTYRKLMSLYGLSFGFRQPYQVLVDAPFCKDAHALNTDAVKQLSTVLQGTVKPMITQCCIHELYLQGKDVQPVVDLAKSFERRKCNHREAIAGDRCLLDVVGETNKHRYVIASQANALRAQLRKIPAVPLVHITRSVMILEPPSEATLAGKEAGEEQSQKPSTQEAAKLRQLDAAQAAAEPPRKKRKGPKGPNPLSVKKKKITQPEDAGRARERRAGAARPTRSSTSQERGAHAARTQPLPDTVTGVKRKKGAEDADSNAVDVALKEGQDGSGSPASREAGPVAVGHKRKRRRKTGPSPGEPVRAAGGVEEDGGDTD